MAADRVAALAAGSNHHACPAHQRPHRGLGARHGGAAVGCGGGHPVRIRPVPQSVGFLLDRADRAGQRPRRGLRRGFRGVSGTPGRRQEFRAALRGHPGVGATTASRQPGARTAAGHGGGRERRPAARPVLPPRVVVPGRLRLSGQPRQRGVPVLDDDGGLGHGIYGVLGGLPTAQRLPGHRR